MDYVIISPVKNELRYIEHTLKSMVAQTRRPLRWVIVDDCSTDGTSELLAEYASSHPFIHVVRNQEQAKRAAGTGVIKAFNLGLPALAGLSYDLIVKLDCDLSFESDYFERLLRLFEADPKLGICSGVYLEQGVKGAWTEVFMPFYHAAGASKMVRRECFEQIGGFVAARGWDTVDEIRAMTLGWKTCHERQARMLHWKPEGSAAGAWKTNLMLGEIYYLTGGSLGFFLLKVLRRAFGRPYFYASLAMSYGHWGAFLNRKPKLVTREEQACYRRMLNARMLSAIKGGNNH